MHGRHRSGHRKLKIDGSLEASGLNALLSHAAENRQHSAMSCDEVTFDPRTTALMMEFLRIYNRVWDRMDFEFCDGQFELVITTALCLESVKRLFIACDEKQEHLVESMSTFLQINSSLTTLWLLVPLTNPTLTHLGDMLSNAKTLQKLSLSGSQFADEGPAELARGLRENKTLQSLDISCCVLSDTDITLILQSLQHHTELLNLDASRNRCREKALDAIAELLLSDDCNLQTLDLREQDINDDEAMEISGLATALSINAKLKSLKLSKNKLNDEQVLKLAEALRRNNTLSALDLQWNKITDETVKQCSRILSEMMGLEVLLLGGNSIGQEGVTLLESLPGDDESICTINDGSFATINESDSEQDKQDPMHALN